MWFEWKDWRGDNSTASQLDVQGTLHPVIIQGIEKGPVVVDDLDRAKFIRLMGRMALETGTKIYARFLMPHGAPILLWSGDCAAAGCFDLCYLSDLSQKGKELVNLVNSVPENISIRHLRYWGISGILATFVLDIFPHFGNIHSENLTLPKFHQP